MPSASLVNWQTVRLTNLAHIDAQCAASVAAVPPIAALVDENLRAYVLLLAAHFQGFCRDLHTESAQILASKVRLSLQILFQDQFSARRLLDQGNATFGNIVADFSRFGFAMQPLLDGLPGSVALKGDLHRLNEWRNIANFGHVRPLHPRSIVTARSPLYACRHQLVNGYSPGLSGKQQTRPAVSAVGVQVKGQGSHRETALAACGTRRRASLTREDRDGCADADRVGMVRYCGWIVPRSTR